MRRGGVVFGKKIDLDENILDKNRIPLLIEDPEWIKLFGDNKNRCIQDAKEELLKLSTRKNILESYSRKLQKNKTKYMKKILKVSESVNSDHNQENQIGFLDEYKESILKINEEIEDIRFQLEMLPKEIKKANFNLLTETVQYGYNELNSRKKTLNKSLEEIHSLRVRLKELFEIKYDNEEWINATYTFLHGLLGREVIEEIDRKKLR